MKKFRSIHADLAIDVFYDPNTSRNLNAIVLSGFPSFPSSNAFTSELVNAGYVVFQPHYYGTFDSNGSFTFNSMIQTVVDTAQLLGCELPDAKSDFQATGNSICHVLLGHSFGGVAAAYAAAKLSNLERLILASSGIRYSLPSLDTGLNENFSKHLSSVRRLWRNSYRLGDDGDWSHIIDSVAPKPTPNQRELNLEVFMMIGENDPYFEHEKVFRSNRDVLMALLGKSTHIEAALLPGAGHAIDSVVGGIDARLRERMGMGCD